ncbi:hypothetical protein BT93_F2996 [Corymbia citriodora subsp. variegata]|nr:hypothetical protein BT93_F2996 [Corymbia citriodora subsp. variegata]
MGSPEPYFKRDIAVLQFQNQKLVQKLESQRVEQVALENKLSQLTEKQLGHDSRLEVVRSSWEELLSNLESCSVGVGEAGGAIDRNVESPSDSKDEDCPLPEDVFLGRLIETGADGSSSMDSCSNDPRADPEMASEKTVKTILRNIALAIDGIYHEKERLHSAVLGELPQDDSSRQRTSMDLAMQLKNSRVLLGELHLKHRLLARELQSHRDIDAKNKAELKRLKGELESTISELEESHSKLATLKVTKDSIRGGSFPVLNFGNKHTPSDKVRDKQRDLQEMESVLKELQDQAESRLEELKALYEERVKILQQLPTLQNKIKNLKCISLSQTFISLKDQLEISKSEVLRYQALYEKLQMERGGLFWRELELSIKTDIVDAYKRCSGVADSRMIELETEIKKQMEDRNIIETKLKEASNEAGRQEIVNDFRALVSSFPEEMGAMQSELSKYKEAAMNIHSLRADVQCFSHALDRTVKECEILSETSASEVAEIEKLKTVVQDLERSILELKLILEMYRRESTDSRVVEEAKNSEYKAWAQVESLKSSLNEHQLELRVKNAIEAEALSQQKLAAAEAEIADLRQKLEASKREISQLADVLKSKNEENEAYLSEIESIGQEYDDMQTQNQHLLQQIAERDDYNIKLVLEGVRARQVRDSLSAEKQTLAREIQLANASVDFLNMKVVRVEDQLNICTEKVQKLAEDRSQGSNALDNTQKRLSDVRRLSHQIRESLEELQFKVDKSRGTAGELQAELERERFKKKRLEEELEVVRGKAIHLQAQVVTPVVEKLQEELRGYQEILKCSICHDRPKEVVVTKCYHLFCNACIQNLTETRHRKCPSCGASFGPNDVKPVYF